jgi:acyl transferase domain-containing protein/non-ribosomal peptide synthetase component F/acyl carrier protein
VLVPAATAIEPIAIVGMSGRFASASSTEELWRALAAGENLVHKVTRWDIPGHAGMPQDGMCEYGGLLNEIDCFDSLFFNISGAEARYMDPQQRFFLEESWHALEDAGYAGLGVAGRRCGVYLGCANGDYHTLFGPEAPPQAFWGNAGSIIPARIAYYLDLKGPAVAIDTACSSSLVAIHMACQSLRTGDTDLALAGGVFITCTPSYYRAATRAGMLSPKGACHTFDARADGFVPGEGVGVLVLKRLSKALADGDHIHGVIAASGTNQDGHTNGITAPSALSQERLEREVYDKFGIDPRSIHFVEAHGTGTKLGDPIEIQALTRAFGLKGSPAHCAIGSVKTNVGHTAMAAGVAGIVKVLLSMKHGQLPPSLHYEEANPHIDFSNSPFFVNATLSPWPGPAGATRRAAVSSFGFSGTNAHLVIEEAPKVSPERDTTTASAHLVVLSARTAEQLRAVVERMIAHCSVNDVDCGNLAYTLLCGRRHMPYRLACVVKNVAELKDMLGRWQKGEPTPLLHVGEAVVVNEKAFISGLVEQTVHDSHENSPEAYGRYLTGLAELYVRGGSIDNERLFAAGRYRRVPLPTYPFSKESHWVPALPGAVDSTQATHAPQAQAVLHPLLQANTSDLSCQRFTSVWTGNEFFLRDHVIHGMRILPGVAFLELVHAAALRAAPLGLGRESSRAVSLEQVTWLRPLAVMDQPVTVHVILIPQGEDLISFQVCTEVAETGGDLLHAQGMVRLTALGDAPRLDLVGLRAGCPMAFPASACYATLEQLGVSLGGALRSVQNLAVRLSDEKEAMVVSDLAMPVGLHGQAPAYVLHPSMMDGSLQSSMGFLLARQQGERSMSPLVPFALGKLEVFGPVPTLAHAVLRLNLGSVQDLYQLDIDLTDTEGRVCVRMTGLSVRSLPRLSASTGRLALVPRWTERPIEARQGGEVPAAQGRRHIILCELGLGTEALTKELSDATVVAMSASATPLALRYVDHAAALLSLLQQLDASTSRERIHLQLVVPVSGEAAVFKGLSALLRSAQLESPRLVTQLVCVSPLIDSAVLAKCLEDEARSGALAVRYAGSTREVFELADLPSRADVLRPGDRVEWLSQGVYLITGGARGVGLAIAGAIARQARGVTLIIVGRSPLDGLPQAAVDTLRRQGAKVDYHQVDVASGDAVHRLVSQVQESHGRLDGVLHCAGVVLDKTIAAKTPRELAEVMAPKVLGTVNLDEATSGCRLQCFALFSSLAAVTGNIGQADYAAANAFMDGFAEMREQRVEAGARYGRSLSVNWPEWSEGGMQLNAATRERLRTSLGLEPLPIAEGMAALEEALASGLPQQVLTYGNVVRLRHGLAAALQATTPRSGQPLATDTGRASGGKLMTAVQSMLIREISQILQIRTQVIDPRADLSTFGFDSISLTQVGKVLLDRYGIDVPLPVFFEHRTVEQVSAHLVNGYGEVLAKALHAPAEQQPASARPEAAAPVALPRTTGTRFHRPPVQEADTRAAEPIAIIAMNGRFPRSPDLDSLWANLREGRDCVTEVPADRWDHSVYFDAKKAQRGKSHGRWGGFIAGVDQFDPHFFGILPRDASAMDPQERLFLENVWSLLESQGHTRASLRKRYQGRVGVYVGTMYQEYRANHLSNPDDVLVPLSSYSAIANRVSYFFDFEGPSIALDTMCSSAAMAIHMACRDLQRGDCELAIAGGVNLSVHPDKFVALSQIHLLGSHAGSRSFSDGDGYLPAETVGSVLLKPLSQALKDQDTVLAVIKGTAVGHAGRSNGYAVPNVNAQVKVMRECLRLADMDPATVSYVEAAANGSALGDAIEMASLAKLFPHREGAEPVVVGAVKSNIGHPEAASGVAQLAKVVLQMQHGEIAPFFEAAPRNPHVRLEGTGLDLRMEASAWTRRVVAGTVGMQELPRRALINSFGAGGTYVCLAIEEPAAIVLSVGPASGQRDELVVLSARTTRALHAMARQMLVFLEQHEAVRLSDLAFTLQVGREAMERRMALVVGCREDLIESLKEYTALPLQDEPHDGTAWLVGDSEAMTAAAKSLLFGAHGDAMVRSLLSSHDLPGLALYWVQGGDVPWESFYADTSVRRIRLPAYPFANKRYWNMVIDASADRAVTELAPCLPGPDAGAVKAVGRADGRIDTLLKRIAAGRLGVTPSEVPMMRPLRDLGFSSIDAVALKHELERDLGIEVPLALLGGGDGSLRELARRLEAMRVALPSAGPASLSDTETSVAGVQGPLTIVPRADDRFLSFPLNDIQESFLAGRMMASKDDPVGAHIYLEIEADHGLDVYRLNAAWRQVMQRHDMLRVVVTADHQQQVGQSDESYRIKSVDLRHMPEEQALRRREGIRSELESKVYDPLCWPLFEIRVSLHAGHRAVIYVSIDELVVDGLSLQLLLRDWSRFYRNPEVPRAPLALTFRDYVLAMKEVEDGPRHKRDLAYWVDCLQAAPSAPAFLRGLNNGSRLHRSRLTAVLPSEQWTSLKRYATRLNVSPTVLVFGAFSETLRAASGEGGLSIVMTYFNRPPLHPEVNEMVGPAISTTVFPLRASRTGRFEELLRSQQRQLWEHLDHASVSGIRAVRELKARRLVPSTWSLPVVFTSVLSNLSFDQEEDDRLGRVVYTVNQTPQVYLDHQVGEREGCLHLSWDVAENPDERGLMARLFDSYRMVLERLAEDTEHTERDLASMLGDIGAWAPAWRPLASSRLTVSAEPDRQHEPFPLTDQQQAYAFGRSATGQGAGGSCQIYQEVMTSELDLPRLEAAWADVVKRHPMLHTTIGSDGSQRRMDAVPAYAIQMEDLHGLGEAQEQLCLAETRTEMIDRVASLDSWPYFEIRVSRLPSKKACIHLALDMLVADGASICLLLSDLLKSYGGEGAGKNAPGITFRDYQVAVERFRSTLGHAASINYWSEKFQALPPGPALPRLATGKLQHLRVDGRLENWSALKDLAQSHAVQARSVLLAAYLEVLFSWNDKCPLAVVVPTWERLACHADVNELVGDFTSLAWVGRTQDSLPFLERVQQVERELLADLAQRPVSGLSILRKLALRSRERRLGYPVVFTDQLPKIEVPAGDFALGHAMSKTPQVLLDNISFENGGVLECAWDSSGVYDAGMVSLMFEGYLGILSQLGSGPGAWQALNFDEVIQARPHSFVVSSRFDYMNESAV